MIARDSQINYTSSGREREIIKPEILGGDVSDAESEESEGKHSSDEEEELEDDEART